MWHVVRRGHRNGKGHNFNEHGGSLTHLHNLKDKTKQKSGKRWCDMGSSDEEDEDDRSTVNVWDTSSASNELTPRSDSDVAGTKGDSEQKSETAPGEPATPSTSESWQDQHQVIDKLRPHAPSLASGSVSTAEPSPVAAPSYPPPDVNQSLAQPNAATMAGMIPIFHPSGPFPECVVNGGVCPIPWHPKEPHVHVMHVLFNSTTASTTNTDDEELGSGRHIEGRSGREILEAIDGRWYCPSEGPGLAYDINAQKRRVSKLWIDEAGNIASKIWDKRLIIDSKDVYWGTSRTYILAKEQLFDNELQWVSMCGKRGWSWKRLPIIRGHPGPA